VIAQGIDLGMTTSSGGGKKAEEALLALAPALYAPFAKTK
jgi:hypothetical protein